MTLLDHQNRRAKLISLISVLGFIVMAFLATQISDNASIHTHYQESSHQKFGSQAGYQQTMAQQKAYLDPETGTFTTKPRSVQGQSVESQSSSGIQARSATFRELQGDLTQDKALEEEEDAEPQIFKEFNNSFVIPAPRALHSKLVGHRPSEAEIQAGADSIIFKHEHIESSQPEQTGL